MQLVNEAQFLNITFLPVYYTSLYSYKLDLSLDVLKLVCLLTEYVPLDSSFSATQCFVLNIDGWFDVLSATPLSNKFAVFDIPLLHCYTNLNSSVICCLSSRDMYLFLGVSILLFCDSLGEFF